MGFCRRGNSISLTQSSSASTASLDSETDGIIYRAPQYICHHHHHYLRPSPARVLPLPPIARPGHNKLPNLVLPRRVSHVLIIRRPRHLRVLLWRRPHNRSRWLLWFFPIRLQDNFVEAPGLSEALPVARDYVCACGGVFDVEFGLDKAGDKVEVLDEVSAETDLFTEFLEEQGGGIGLAQSVLFIQEIFDGVRGGRVWWWATHLQRGNGIKGDREGPCAILYNLNTNGGEP